MIKEYHYSHQVLNMKTNGSISSDIAKRQLEVIEKAYQYLTRKGNDIIYIADEVGLGKTYIALGIAMLFRHHSPNPEQHKDIIVVPKKNLQQKWKKELKNFIQHNYLQNSHWVKILGDQTIIKDRLCPISTSDLVSIFRMTSLSTVASGRKDRLKYYNELITNTFCDDKFFTDLIISAKGKGYFNQENEHRLFKLVAYLMNAASPKINCLIIDEAHNYKHGIGDNTHDGSIRNEVTARFLGAINDTSILNDFPELKSKLKFPLAEKVICLSATPKDRSLFEIKNQLSCFTNDHILRTSNTTDEIRGKLNSFLIRGNMEYDIEGEKVSRNQVREEHRKGNVNKYGRPKPLIVEDRFESIFWQLLQYKSIKHLDEKNSASFEIGMLAGFESYSIDKDKKLAQIKAEEQESYSPDSKEYEQTSKRNIRESQDGNLVRGLVKSYQETFSHDLPPHPKQSKLEDELTQQFRHQEKSIVFVRRVATAYELAERLLHHFEQFIAEKLALKGRYAKYQSPKLTELLDALRDKYVMEQLDDCLSKLSSRADVSDFAGYKMDANLRNDHMILDWLRFCYYDPLNKSFKKEIREFIIQKKKNFGTELKDITIAALERSFINWQSEVKELSQEQEEENEDKESSSFFFHNYFKKGKRGFRFRQKLYRENWLDLNFYLFNERFKVFGFDSNKLTIHIKNSDIQSDKKKHQIFGFYQQLFKEFIEGNTVVSYTKTSNTEEITELSGDTFLTSLLVNHCRIEMEQWIASRKQDPAVFFTDLNVLSSILLNIFRNGTGLIPAFVADASEKDFTISLTELIVGGDAPFGFLLGEIKTIINDFDILIAVNFQEKDIKKINTTLRNMIPVVGVSGSDNRDRSMLATQFRMPGYPYILVSTDIFREGEDLHTYCQNIYHYGIAWNPSDMEQRTGRIDRINSMSYRKLNREKTLSLDNMVHVFYPYLTNSVEVNQVVQLLKNINQFIKTFNTIETDNHFPSVTIIDEEITEHDIPEAIKSRVRSKYDIDNFNISG